MSYATRKEAIAAWLPEKAYVMYDYDATIVYLHRGRLVVLRVFSLSNRDWTKAWHVSVDVDKSLDELQRRSDHE